MSNSTNKQNGRTTLSFGQRALLAVSTGALALGATCGFVAQASATVSAVKVATMHVSNPNSPVDPCVHVATVPTRVGPEVKPTVKVA